MNNKKINGKPVAYLPCCGIFAAAVVMGQEPQKVFNAYKREYGKSNRWLGSTYTNETLKFLTKKKVRWSEVKLNARMTVKKFGEMYAKPSGVYMIWTSTHVMTLYKGELIDQGHHQKISEAKGNRSIVKKAILIENPKPLMEGLVCESETEHKSRLSNEREEEIKKKVHNLKHQEKLKEILATEGSFPFEVNLNKVVSWQGREWKLVGYNAREKNPFVLMMMKNGEPCYEFYGATSWRWVAELFKPTEQVEALAA